jgi:hypothetical protein
MLHRLPKAKINSQRQRRNQLGEPNAAQVTPAVIARQHTPPPDSAETSRPAWPHRNGNRHPPSSPGAGPTPHQTVRRPCHRLAAVVPDIACWWPMFDPYFTLLIDQLWVR